LRLFRALAHTLGMQEGLFAIDEAHVLHMWGSERSAFRPDYAALGMCLSRLSSWLTVAVTATATAPTQQAICAALSIPATNIYHELLDRPNIFISVSLCRDFPTQHSASYCSQLAKDFIFPLIRRSDSGHKFIVYGFNLSTLSNVYVEVRDFLGTTLLVNPNGGDSFANHSVVLFSSIRGEAECASLASRLMDSESGLIGVIASSALGLGCVPACSIVLAHSLVCLVTRRACIRLDSKFVNNVMIIGAPPSIEEFAQCMGRAGRAGQEATCSVVLRCVQRMTPEVVRHVLRTTGCRRDAILCPFGQGASRERALPSCCDNCRLEFAFRECRVNESDS